MFKAFLLPLWYDLSDVRLAEALDDSARFVSFCGFSGTAAAPEHIAIARFYKALVSQGLDRQLFEAVRWLVPWRIVSERGGIALF